jgi:SNF2 family DNA or RNA helicase
VINQASIHAFLARKLDSFDWLKSKPTDELIETVDTMLPNKGWWDHQRVCFLLLSMLKRFMLFVDMGGGKTFIVLSLLKYRKLRGEKPQAIVFVPYITSVGTWIDETAKHTPELVCVPLLGSTDNNLQKLQNADGDLFVICYQSAVAMMAEDVQRIGVRKKKWTIDPRYAREVFARFDTLVMDEVHRCKSVQSLTYRLCRTISAKCEYVTGLTGTPFGRDLQDLWPQFYLIDFGKTLGPTLGFYREVFFVQKINYWGGFKYKFKQKLFDKLQQVIKNASIRYNINEFHDMPPKEYVQRKINTHSGIKSYADKAMTVIRGIQVQKSASNYRAMESEYLKLRQLSSGFMTLHGDDSAKLQVAFDENPKLDALQELIEDMPYGCKMVVFHHFVYTNNLISERLKQMKVGHARIYGNSKNPLAELRKFGADDKCRVLVINSRSGSSSLNLQHANYVVFFEQPDSAIDRQQAESRCWRPGQGKRVFIYDFLMEGTADTPMHKANKAGENLLKNLLDGKIKL